VIWFLLMSSNPIKIFGFSIEREIILIDKGIIPDGPHRLELRMSVQQLRTLANAVDVSVGNAILLLYSGGVGVLDPITGLNEFSANSVANALADGVHVKTIANTEVSSFLKNSSFENALDAAINADVSTNGTNSQYWDSIANRALDVDEVLNGLNASNERVTSSSFWDDASARLVNSHTGSFEIIGPNAPGDGVLMQTELSALLAKQNGAFSTVNGRLLSDWQVDALGNPSAIEDAIRATASPSSVAERMLMTDDISLRNYASLSKGAFSELGFSSPETIISDRINALSLNNVTSSVDAAGNLKIRIGGQDFTADASNILRAPSDYSNFGEFLGAEGADASRIASEFSARSNIVRGTAGGALAGLGLAAMAYDAFNSIARATSQYNSGDTDGAWRTVGELIGRQALGWGAATVGVEFGLGAAGLLLGSSAAAAGGALAAAAGLLGGVAGGFLGGELGTNFGGTMSAALNTIDSNHNGTIDNGAELFGDQTGYANGFEDLRVLVDAGEWNFIGSFIDPTLVLQSNL
jgi:hypothetical protein